MAYLELKNLTVCYGNFKAVEDLNLKIAKDELFTFLGPSGSGKSTILLTIAGFIMPSQGKIILEGEDITQVPANKRNVGMVFQSYTLFPHMTVLGNIAFPLRVRKLNRERIQKEVQRLLKLVNLEGLGMRYPNELSGGEQQRVALTRALSFEPKILLLDEPLGSLDKKLREYMKIEIKRLQKELKSTILYVTHDQSEALAISSRIAVIRKGMIEQVGNPKSIYEAPENEFVANFIGESNFLPAKILDFNESFLEILLFGKYNINIPVPKQFNSDWKICSLMIRPESFHVFSKEQNASFSFPAVVEEIIYLGDSRKISFLAENNQHIVIKDYEPSKEQIEVGKEVYLSFDLNSVKAFAS